MSKLSQSTRRSFLKKAITGAIITGVPSGLIAQPDDNVLTLENPANEKKFSPNDQVNIAVIGMGIMGFNNLETSVQIPGVKLIAACDLYSGRLDRTKELYGKDIFTTKDYREILDRK